MAGELDAKLCCELPEELLNLVLRRLPLSSLCRFRAVSKHWNTLPTVRPVDPYYLDIPRDLSPSRLRHCSLYSLFNNKWDALDLSFLSSRMAQLCSLQYPWRPHTEIQCFCSDGGLLCLRAGFNRGLDTIRYEFFVCNPLTRNCKRLPFCSFELQTCVCVELVMHRDPSSGGYKIFALTEDYTDQRGFIHRHFMYDSTSDARKLILDLNRDDCSDIHLSHNCTIVFEGVYYCVSGGGGQAYEFFAYDIQQDTWIAAGVKVKLDLWTAFQVLFVVSSKRLLLIASSTKKRLVVFRTHRVDLCKMDDLVETVVLPANSSWNDGVAVLACGDSNILLSSPNCKFMAQFKLGSGLKELQLDVPTWRMYKHTVYACRQGSVLTCKQPSKFPFSCIGCCFFEFSVSSKVSGSRSPTYHILEASELASYRSQPFILSSI